MEPQTDLAEQTAEFPQNFSDAGTAEVSSRWWEAFGDEDLNGLIEQALEENFRFKEFQARAREARAVARLRVSDQLPDVDLEVSGESEDSDSNFGGGASDRFFAGVSAGYELDLWGRFDALADAGRFQAEASAEDLRALGVTISAETALARVDGVAARGAVALLNEQVEDNASLVDLLTNRFRAGQAERVDVLRQEQLLLETRRLLSTARADARLLTHQLALLLGEVPGVYQTDDETELPEVPPLPSTGIPLETLTRRPDVRAAWLDVLAADRETAAAISARFPRISLTASYGSESEEFSEILEEWLWILAGNLTAPLFDGGERRFEVDRTEAVREQRVAAYSLTLLEAMKEVEDALVRERQQADRVQDLARQEVLAAETLQQLELSYQNGVASFLDVLSARTQLQELERETLFARRDRLRSRIALYRALAGGFNLKEDDDDEDQ